MNFQNTMSFMAP